jgi:heptosyltransferase-3
MRDPRSVLLIATRQIGDVLLATPLLRTLRRAWPNSSIDVLVYRNKGGMLEGSPDLNRVIEVSEHPGLAEYVQFLPKIFRRYDLVVNTLSGDRPHFYALWAGRSRVGVVPEKGGAWKRWLNHKSTALDNAGLHTVLLNLRLAELLGVKIFYDLVPPTSSAEDVREAKTPFRFGDGPFVVLHPFPMWRYKRWTQVGWRELIDHLLGTFSQVILTGGPEPEERAAHAELVAGRSSHVISLAGEISFAEVTPILRKAKLFIGPDTAMTHLAAGLGVPTVALYGPSNPVKWGPWPHQHQGSNPWVRLSRPFQKSGNVLLLQGIQPKDREACVPCAEEGCERNKESYSACLDQLPVSDVLAAVRALLGDQLVVLSTEIKAE